MKCASHGLRLNGAGLGILWMLGLAAAAPMVLSSVVPARAEATVQAGAPLTSRGSAEKETGIGDLIADAVRSAAGSQVALVNAESLRTVDVPKGSAGIAEFTAALTFKTDPVVVLSLKGETLQAALERGVANLPQPSPGFLQVSGLAFAVNAAAHAGSRVSHVSIAGRPLDPGATYTVAMPQSLAQGADGYFLVWPPSTPSQPVTETLGQAVTEYLSEHSSLSEFAPRIIA